MFRFFGRRRSKDDVKERLKLVLSYDRAKLTPGKMEDLKTELLGVIGKYFPSSEQEYDVRFEQHGERMVLMANLPMSGRLSADEDGSQESASSREAAGGAASKAQSDQGQKQAPSASSSRNRKKGKGKRRN